jgi:hypothetical protein
LDARNTKYGLKPDGTQYVWTENINPVRIYVGLKGYKEDGTLADPSDFLARNGLRYGQMYGYAINMTSSGPSKGLFRDQFHLSVDASNGKEIKGKWIAQKWRWNGTVTNFEDDGAWDYQLPTGVQDYVWWNAGGVNVTGFKSEHGSPVSLSCKIDCNYSRYVLTVVILFQDLRPGITGFVQTSTAGYFGHYYVDDIVAQLTANVKPNFPSSFEGRYFVYQGERSVVAQVELGGAGLLSGGRDMRYNWDSQGFGGTGKATFEDLDGFEVLIDDTGSLYAVIQEDSTSVLGDRMFITKLEHLEDSKELKYYFVAMSGGSRNSRMLQRVGIPAGTGSTPQAHEFSGIFDLSGLLYKSNGTFVVQANTPTTGKAMRDSEAKVAINDKLILINLQSHSMNAGLISGYRADRGGQIYLYQPKI